MSIGDTSYGLSNQEGYALRHEPICGKTVLGYQPCKRVHGHTGPCAHVLNKQHVNDVLDTTKSDYDPDRHEYGSIERETALKGGLTNYYLVRVEHPQRKDQPAYTAECEDVGEALGLSPDEMNIFKEIWRSANARQGNGKPDHKALYGAEKIVHYAGRILRRLKRAAA